MFLPLLLATLATAPVAPLRPLPRSIDRAAVAVILAGRVTDSTGRPIVDARVTVLEANRSTTTDAEGRFRIGGIPEGTYGISIAAIGFRPRVYRLALTGATTTLEAKLLPTVVELATIQTTATPRTVATPPSAWCRWMLAVPVVERRPRATSVAPDSSNSRRRFRSPPRSMSSRPPPGIARLPLIATRVDPIRWNGVAVGSSAGSS